MASASSSKLEVAINKVVASYERLEAATLSASLRGSEIESGQRALLESQTAQYETALAEAVSENTFLKEDNLRLSNQLQALQKDYLALQEAASSTLVRLDDSVKQIDLLLEH